VREGRLTSTFNHGWYGGATPHPQRGTGACSAISVASPELCTASRVPHSAYPMMAARNSGSAGNPASSAASDNSVTNRNRCSSEMCSPRCLASMCSYPPRAAVYSAGPPITSDHQVTTSRRCCSLTVPPKTGPAVHRPRRGHKSGRASSLMHLDRRPIRRSSGSSEP
jgi:hypothetical protein